MFRVKLCSTQIMDKLMKFNVKKWFYLFFLYLINKLDVNIIVYSRRLLTKKLIILYKNRTYINIISNNFI